MRSNFEELNKKRLTSADSFSVDFSGLVSSSTVEGDENQDNNDDCFELLSAYIDGEVTPCERAQVQEWLDNDPEIHCLYIELLRVNQGFKQMPPPQPLQSAERLSEQVFRQVDQQRHRRFFLIGGTLITALVVGALGCLGKDSLVPKFAQKSPSEGGISEESLMIALNRPIMEIPTSEGLEH